LYDQGNNIVYWTARGQTSKTDHTELTTIQLKEWGCKYHELKMDKPSFDILIDDKTINPLQFFVKEAKTKKLTGEKVEKTPRGAKPETKNEVPITEPKPASKKGKKKK
jgi:hypothetical protein